MFGKTPLSHVAENSHVTMVKLLSAAGANLNYKSVSGRSHLSLAAQSGHEGVVRLLLAADGVEHNAAPSASPVVYLASPEETDALIKTAIAWIPYKFP